MALASMRLSAEEASEMMNGDMPDVVQFPPGLRLSLTEDDLVRLGLAMPEAGGCMRISAEGCVMSVNTRVEGGGEVESCVYVQITDMSMTPFTPKKSIAKTLYPDLPEA